MKKIKRDLLEEMIDCYFEGYINKSEYYFLNRVLYNSEEFLSIPLSEKQSKRVKKILEKLNKQITLQNM